MDEMDETIDKYPIFVIESGSCQQSSHPHSVKLRKTGNVLCDLPYSPEYQSN